jgi:hypothetical protein
MKQNPHPKGMGVMAHPNFAGKAGRSLDMKDGNEALLHCCLLATEVEFPRVLMHLYEPRDRLGDLESLALNRSATPPQTFRTSLFLPNKLACAETPILLPYTQKELDREGTYRSG